MTTDTQQLASELPQPDAATTTPQSEKSFLVTWILSLLLGFFAVDRFYLGKVGTGILKLLTFGGFGIWYLIDLILVLTGAQKDKQGSALAGYNQHKKIAWIVMGAIVALSLITSALNGGSADSTPVDSGEPSTEQSADIEAPAEDPVEEIETVHSWADESFGTFETITQSGTGDNLVTLPQGVKAGIVTATHDGGSNFVINALNASNDATGDLLVNTIGAYNGINVYGFNSFSEATTLEIKADGNWSISIAPISTAPALVTSGAGDGVYLFDGPSGKLTATHDGSSNFVLFEETSETFSMGLLVNEIGAYSGTVPLSAGPSVITVKADGAWTLVAE